MFYLQIRTNHQQWIKLLSELAGGCIYGAIDLEEAYTQIPVDGDTSHMLTVNTVQGLHSVMSLPFGIKIASSAFQSIIDGLFGPVKGVIAYQDNIYVKGTTVTEYRARLLQVLHILGDVGFRVNSDKCVWQSASIEVLGFRLDAEGIHLTSDKTASFTNTPSPCTKQELQSLLGLISFYGSFFKDKTTILEPLHCLLDLTSKWAWTTKHQVALQAVKDILTSHQVLAHYNPDLPLVVTANASPVGVGAVLAHIVPDAQPGKTREIPICLRISNTRAYSHLDREGLSIIFAVKRFTPYLAFCRFTIITDYKPLLGIFSHDRPTPLHLAPRMLRWTLILNSFDYELCHKPGTAVGHADCLSRLPQPTPGENVFLKPASVHLLEARDLRLQSPRDIARAADSDVVFRQVKIYIHQGWPSTVHTELLPFYSKREALSFHSKCVLGHERVVIPSALQETVRSNSLNTSRGENYSKAMARSIVWWPNIGSDIMNKAKLCKACQTMANTPPRSIVCSWAQAERAWERMHLDYAESFLGNYLLSSPIVEVVSSLTAAIIITHMRYVLADFVKPLVIVTDNGWQFTSERFNKFLQSNGIHHLYTQPWHPSSNGLAEHTKLLLKSSDPDIYVHVARTLWAMHKHPSSSTGKTSAEAVGRTCRTHLTQLHPALESSKPASAFSSKLKLENWSG
ncbi:hypothetical protein PR048_032168 [Dryococelus australis]|uniref:Uncharacterized protein n=1 Tax=Dryococelus australis TaxID=614101 RepID=A0ABQ9G1G5_9NEOP|nr:hypothetical protein PR048_032168 [Dryococelus australis]